MIIISFKILRVVIPILIITSLLVILCFSAFSYYDPPNGSVYPNVSDYVAWLDWFNVFLGIIKNDLAGLPNNYPSIDVTPTTYTGIYQRLYLIYNNLLSFDSNFSLLVPIDNFVSLLTDFFADSDRLALEASSEDSVVVADFIYTSSPNGSSASQNLGDLGSFSSDISSELDTGVSADYVFDILNTGSDGDDGSIFGLFSNRAMYELDPSLNSRSSSSDVVTDYFSFNSVVREVLSHV